MINAQRIIETEIGTLYLVASELGLQGIFWIEKNVPMETDPKSAIITSILNKTEQQLSEYFAGQRRDFDLPLDVIGTPFQKKVWNELNKIKYGETRSYKDIAQAIGDKNACRAVGSANGKNPLSIVVPCHRVIAANGTLSGYAGKVKRKARLLELERQA